MSILLGIALLHFLAQLTPGPDILLISKIAVSQGRIPALFAVTGITLGIVIWIIITLTGFSVLLKKWAWFQYIIMTFGAIFLFKMGFAMCQSFIHYLKHKNQLEFQDNANQNISISNFKYLSQGFITNMINPKALIYFASVFSIALTSPEIQNLKIPLAIFITIETFLVFALLVWLLSTAKIKAYYQQYASYIDGIAGVLFIGFAGSLAYQVIQFVLHSFN